MSFLIINGIILAFLWEYVSIFLKPMIAVICRKNSPHKPLKQDISNLQDELSKISMIDEFAKYARLQRKLNALKDKLGSESTQHLQEMVKLNLLVTGITQVLLGLITITFLWMYWYEPVLVFPKAWVAPISSFISFPTSIDGAIGLPFWFSVCKVFAKSTSTLITFKK
ncbi:guided entry of tail-anchored proteins factor 1 [Nilaparvata lugens]|uniref:guided entry of tail-anchored proteins factor 1 n=1 Tax=Nilaparvata lugens TaxID=108931 RepID=UPI00193E1AED|nr:guided entry of tail-anchored proteins factor 1 [Nilaparvata lugens]